MIKSYEESILLSIQRVKRKISEVRADDSIVFPVFTDLHTQDINHENTQKLICALTLITKEIDYDAVIDLGDNFDMLGRNIHISNEELEARFGRVLSSVYEASKHPIINVNGNHDAIGTDFFKPDFWSNIVKNKYGNTMSVYGDEGCYYYIDYEKAKTRLVILSLPHDSDIECEMPTPAWGFGKKQLTWLKETALNTNKDVIILSHVPFFYKYLGDKEKTLSVWTGEKEKVSYVSALSGYIEDLSEAVSIMEEYKSKPGAKLVACLSGHIHTDLLLMPYEKKDVRQNPLPCHQIVTPRFCPPDNTNMQVGISMDVAVWTQSNGELYMFRIGDGEDRSIKLL